MYKRSPNIDSRNAAETAKPTRCSSRKRRASVDEMMLKEQRPAKRRVPIHHTSSSSNSVSSPSVDDTFSSPLSDPSSPMDPKWADHLPLSPEWNQCPSYNDESTTEELNPEPSFSGDLSPPARSNLKRRCRVSSNRSKRQKVEPHLALSVSAKRERPRTRLCPLPCLSWATASNIWQQMCKKDADAVRYRSHQMIDNHPTLTPHMRSVLLDWLVEVCEVYKLHRETYYLTIDFLDRYLSLHQNMPKTRLQLIGITCLFVASKLEEIYPPKISEFAYVTDSACNENDILQQELELLTALKWNLNPTTTIAWLSIYLQLKATNRTPADFQGAKDRSSPVNGQDDTFIYPQYSALEFATNAQLLDLCVLDVKLTQYPYSVTAAAAISHTFNKETACNVSGLPWSTIEPCATWMEPYFRVIESTATPITLQEREEQLELSYGMRHFCPHIVTDDSHILQHHTTSLQMLEQAVLLRNDIASKALVLHEEASPPDQNAHAILTPEGLLTPPSSGRKSTDEADEEADGVVATECDIQLTKTS